MNPRLFIHAVLGSLTVTIGLWMLVGGPMLAMLVICLGAFTFCFARFCPTPSHVWVSSTLLLGVESLAWPFVVIAAMPDLGPEPPLEDMQRVFTAVLFGLFSGVFWLTFSYGIYRRIQNRLHVVESVSSSITKRRRKRS